MTRTLYALLVGINKYQADVPPLFGCVNDVKRMDEFLRARAQGGDFAYQPLLLTSSGLDDEPEDKPTYQRIVQAFRDHLGQARKDDVVLFYYSGHGSQEKAPPEFWHLEPDHLDETMVCYDSRTPGVYDLADKELALLIAEVARNAPHIVVILDACHSGSGTRNPEGTQLRLAPADMRDRPIDAFLPGVVEAKPAQPMAKLGETGQASGPDTGDWLPLPHGRHIVMSACRAEQLAREKLMDDGVTHGLLSYYLVDSLQSTGAGLTYRDIFNRASALVRSQATDQNPVIAATQTDDLLQPFLGGAVQPQPPYFSLEFQRQRGWTLRGGAIHGIIGPTPTASGDQAETTPLAIFPLDHAIQVGEKLDSALGFARVKTVGASESAVDVETPDGQPLDPRTTYKAVVVATPLPPVSVYLSGDDEPSLQALRDALKTSLIVTETSDVSASTLSAIARQDDHLYRLRRTGDRLPLDVGAPKGPGTAALARMNLEHMAQWLQLLQLENKQTQLQPGAVTLEVYREQGGQVEKVEDLTQLRFMYDPERGEQEVRLKLRLVNTTPNRRLYCMLALLSQDFSVTTDSVFFGSGVWLEPGQEAWATQQNGQAYADFWVPDEFVNQGVSAVTDVLKLIVSTDDSDATLLKQEALAMVATRGDRGVTRSAALPRSTLDRLLRRVNTRAGGSRAASDRLSDWRVEQVSITTVRADKGVPLSPTAPSELGVNTGVTVQGHSGLQAKARLTSLSEGSRDVGNLALPAALRQDPNIAEPFRFTTTRGGDGGESVIVLSEVENRAAVTPDNPLIVQTTAPLEPGHAILAVAFDPDSGLFLPLGLSETTAAGTIIRINTLPAPTSDSRSLGGSIKLFFQKMVAEKFGFASDPNRLALVTVNDDFSVSYDASPAALKDRVQPANRILLYVHGIIGDTKGMAASSRGLAQAPADLPRLAERYALILTYDYENLKTPIQNTALKLKQSLAAIELGPNHGKTLHIVAHSMGSLVSRWFIEREGGAQVVQKAVFAGPPMAGSPWPRVEDLVLVGLGVAINGLAALAWPPSIIPTLISTLGAAVGGVEQVDETLDQMKEDSDFYQSLNASADPGVPYVVLAGNTEKIAWRLKDGAARNPVQALVERLTSARTRDELASLLFMNQPNDIAVSVASQTAIPQGRAPAPDTREIACDHLSYFSCEVGIRAIADAL